MLAVTVALQLACGVASDQSLTPLCALCSFPVAACSLGQHFGAGKPSPLAIHSACLLLKKLAPHLQHKVPSLLLQPKREWVTLLACHGHDSNPTDDPHFLLHPSFVSHIRPAALTAGFGYCPSKLDLRPCWSDAEIGTFSRRVSKLSWLTRPPVVFAHAQFHYQHILLLKLIHQF